MCQCALAQLRLAFRGCSLLSHDMACAWKPGVDPASGCDVRRSFLKRSNVDVMSWARSPAAGACVSCPTAGGRGSWATVPVPWTAPKLWFTGSCPRRDVMGMASGVSRTGSVLPISIVKAILLIQPKKTMIF